MNVQEQRQAVKTKFYEVIEKAEEMYGIKLAHTKIRFDLSGNAAGQASIRNWKLGVRFNLEAMEKDWDHVFNNTIPHEIAHLVGYVNPSLAKNHNKGWKQVCCALGGDGKRCHSIDLKGTGRRKYEYKMPCGSIVRCGKQVHTKIQNGYEYSSRISGEKVRIAASFFIGENK